MALVLHAGEDSQPTGGLPTEITRFFFSFFFPRFTNLFRTLSLREVLVVPNFSLRGSCSREPSRAKQASRFTIVPTRRPSLSGVAREDEEREERYAAMMIKGKRLCVFGTRGGVRCASRGVHRWVAHALEGDTQ